MELGHINTSMIIQPNDYRYPTAISESINTFSGYQIGISLTLLSSSLWDMIEIINGLIKDIASGYRKINRRGGVDSYLLVMSEAEARRGVCSILIRHTHQLLEKTVQSRILLVQGLVKKIDTNGNVFQRYEGVENDIRRYHLKDIVGPYSVNIIDRDQSVELKDCAAF